MSEAEKREMFAMVCIHALLSNPNVDKFTGTGDNAISTSDLAIKAADLLIEKLKKPS